MSDSVGGKFRIEGGREFPFALPVFERLNVGQFTVIAVPGVNRESLVAVNFDYRRSPVCQKPYYTAVLKIDAMPLQQFEIF
jgi:hypothetical protein